MPSLERLFRLSLDDNSPTWSFGKRMATVDVSIINYRTGELTIRCLQSALRDLPSDSNVFIVDNASCDGSDLAIENWLAANPSAPAQLIRSTRNAGFAGGHNAGISAGSSDFVLLLNSDAELHPGCLAKLLSAARASPAAGLFFPRLEDADGSVQISCFRYPGFASEVIRGAGSGPVTALLKRWDVPLGQQPDPTLIEWASFACVLLRRSMIERIGAMDEGFFLYFEDIEYCRRAREAGWQLGFVPEARVIHYRGGSGPLKSLAAAKKRLPTYYYASRTRYFHQSGGWLGLIGANLGWILGRCIAQSRRLLGKSVPKTAEAEFRDIWTNVTQPLGPRHAVGE